MQNKILTGALLKSDLNALRLQAVFNEDPLETGFNRWCPPESVAWFKFLQAHLFWLNGVYRKIGWPRHIEMGVQIWRKIIRQ